MARAPHEKLPHDEPNQAFIGGDALWVSMCPNDGFYSIVLTPDQSGHNWPEHYAERRVPDNRFHLVWNGTQPLEALTSLCDFVALDSGSLEKTFGSAPQVKMHLYAFFTVI